MNIYLLYIYVDAIIILISIPQDLIIERNEKAGARTANGVD